MVTRMVYLCLWKGPSKEEFLQLSFELAQSGDIPQTDRQQIPDRWSSETEQVLTTSFKVHFRIFKSFTFKKNQNLHISNFSKASLFLVMKSPVVNHALDLWRAYCMISHAVLIAGLGFALGQVKTILFWSNFSQIQMALWWYGQVPDTDNIALFMVTQSGSWYW